MTDHDDQVAFVAPAATSVSAAGVTSLVALFQTMLLATEKRILDAMAENSHAAADRWKKHDDELERNTQRVTERFVALDARLQTTADALAAHLDAERVEDIRMDARIRPIRGSIAWLWIHWRDVVLLTIGLIALGTFLIDALSHTFGAPS